MPPLGHGHTDPHGSRPRVSPSSVHGRGRPDDGTPSPTGAAALGARHGDGQHLGAAGAGHQQATADQRAGAGGFLLEDAPAEEVLAAIRTVHAGDAVIAPSTTRRLLEHVAADLPTTLGEDEALSALTDRERAVMIEIAHGATNSEIAARLFLAEPTVKTHVGRILAKLGLRDRVQIVIRAYESGLVRRGSGEPSGR